MKKLKIPNPNLFNKYMLKHLFVLFFLGIIHYQLYAQGEDIQYPQMPINEVTGEIKYSDVVQIGNTTPDELFKRSILWFELYYNPKSVSSFKKPRYDNPTSVIQVKDADKKIILANASFQIYKSAAVTKEAIAVPSKGASAKQKNDTTGAKSTPATPATPEPKKEANPNPSGEQASEAKVEETKAIAGEVIYTLKLQLRDGRYKYEIYDIHWDKKSYFGIEQWLDKNSPNATEYINYLNQTNTYFNSLLEDLLEGMQKSTEVPDENDW